MKTLQKPRVSWLSKLFKWKELTVYMTVLHQMVKCSSRNNLKLLKQMRTNQIIWHHSSLFLRIRCQTNIHVPRGQPAGNMPTTTQSATVTNPSVAPVASGRMPAGPSGSRGNETEFWRHPEVSFVNPRIASTDAMSQCQHTSTSK